MPLFVGVTLVSLAGALLVAGRRNAEGILLAFFLALVAINFLGDAARIATGALFPSHVALLAAALDPIFLLLFVTAYPFRRRSRPVVSLLFLVGATSLVTVVLLIAEGTAATLTLSPAHVLLIANLNVAYIAAWLLAARAIHAAPTPLLARRVGWLVIAVGVAVLARISYAAYELRLLPHFGFPRFASSALMFGERFLIVLALGALGRAVARPRGVHAEAGWDRPIRVAILASVAILTVQLAIEVIADLQWISLASWGAVWFGLRWPIFAGLLVYALLAFEDVNFERRSARWLPMLVGSLAAFGVALVTRLALAPLVGGIPAGALALAVGLGALVPSIAAARSAARLVPVPFAGSDRRLELYRAALESAWARGSPAADARERLARDRVAFGVTEEEARALEHVVASGAGARARPLAPGDEPAPGLLVERFLGEGAHGRVFEARRFPSGERVVVKELRAIDASEKAARQRFLAEVRPLLALDHPRIVRLLDYSTAHGRHLLVMRYVDGGPLSKRLAQGPLPERDVARLAEALLDALEAAHARGIVHRDVKPANVLLARDGSPYLADFGVAQHDATQGDFRTTVSNLDALGVPVGTLAYMAPEQASGERATVRSDLYSVGLIVFEALTGHPALDVRGLALLGALERVANAAPDLSLVPPAWRPWLSRALARDPRARWASASEMRDALAGVGLSTREREA